MNADLRGLVKKWRTNVCLAREEKGLLRAADELEAALSVAQGQGFVMVPRVPTENMVVAGFESRPDEHFSPPEEWAEYQAMSGCRQAAHRARLCWAAMLAAAPAQPDGVSK